MTSQFGNIVKAGLQFSPDENKLGVCPLYRPDFAKAQKHIRKLIKKVPKNYDLTNAPDLYANLRRFDRPEIRVWNPETDDPSEKVDCSFDKLIQINQCCDVAIPEGTTIPGNVRIFAKQKSCPMCEVVKTFKFQHELNRHVKKIIPNQLESMSRDLGEEMRRLMSKKDYRVHILSVARGQIKYSNQLQH